MKKIIMFLFGALLVLSLAGVAVAEPTDTTQLVTENDFKDDSGNVISTGTHAVTSTVTLYLSQSFEITLPDAVILKEDTSGANMGFVGMSEVLADVHLLNPGNTLTVTVSSDNNNDYTLENAGKVWILKEKDDTTKHLRYAMRLAGDQTTYVNLGDTSTWLPEGAELMSVSSNYCPAKVTKYLHFRLIDTPSLTGTFEDTLTFTVTVTGPTTPTTP